jgi:cytosine/adenosine deaminase-related metal-dependent hydrolase
LREIHSAPIVLPITSEPIRDGAVAVEHGRVTAVGRRAELIGEHPEKRWSGVLTPGLVNAHTHLNHTAFADFYDNGKPFFEWIVQFPARSAGMTDEAWRKSAEDGIDELLRNGVTAAADVVTKPPALTALHDRGLAGIAYFELVGADSERWLRIKADWLRTLSEASHATLGISPHTVYTLGTKVLTELGEIARREKLRLHPHAAETLHEAEFTHSGTGPFADFAARFNLAYELVGCGSGRTPIHELAAAGLLGSDSHVAHGVHADAEDRALLRKHGTAVALCPRSNERLRAGVAPVAAYRAEGNLVAIGTDSRASAPSLDVLADVTAARQIAKDQHSPADGLSRWLVEAATIGGARAMGLTDVGTLAPGSRADLAVFDVPLTGDPYDALALHGAGACTATVLAGRTVHER